MGMNMFGSRSSYDNKRCNCKCSPSGLSSSSFSKLNKLPNPNPSNWILKSKWEHKGYLLIDLVYPDCKNYEGRKLLLYKDVTWEQLENQKTIDPHFSDNKLFYSPIARFEPTMYGWQNAVILIAILTENYTAKTAIKIMNDAIDSVNGDPRWKWYETDSIGR